MTINKNLYSDVQDGQTNGSQAAALVNDNKRAVNNVIDYINTFGDVVTKNVGTGVSEVPTNADLGSAAYQDLMYATDSEVLSGGTNKIPDSEQVRREHVARVETIAALRALEPAFNGQQIEMLGHTVSGVGGGIFWHDESDTTSADDNGITIVTTSGKRWKRRVDGFLTFEMFGAIGSSDDSSAINSCFESLPDGGKIVTMPDTVYGYQSVYPDCITLDKTVEIEFAKNSGIKRTAGTGTIILQTSGNFTVSGGYIDCDNRSSNYSHMINFSGGGKFTARGTGFLNNLLGGYTTPTASQDIDLVYIVDAAEVLIDSECYFYRCSRNGLTISGAVDSLVVDKGVKFEDCFLFGIDVEPNVSTTYMYDKIEINGAIFKNCGSQGASKYVWNGGGPMNLASYGAGDQSVTLARTVKFEKNLVINDIFKTIDVSLVEPFLKIDQYLTLTFKDNMFFSLDRIILATANSALVSGATYIDGNSHFNVPSGNMNGNLFSYYSNSAFCGKNAGMNCTVTAKDKYVVSSDFDEELRASSGTIIDNVENTKTSLAQGDVIYRLQSKTNDSVSPGEAAYMEIFKPISNSSAYTGFHFGVGAPGGVVDSTYIHFDGSLLPCFNGANSGLRRLGDENRQWGQIYAQLPVYADNAAAVSGGLSIGAFYRTSTGEVRVRV